jgi:hypothetical protein
MRMVAEQDLGLVVRRWADAPRVLKRWCHDPEAKARTRANLAGLPENRAAREALDVLRAEMKLEPSEAAVAAAPPASHGECTPAPANVGTSAADPD